jgi:hypothetical protein
MGDLLIKTVYFIETGLSNRAGGSGKGSREIQIRVEAANILPIHRLNFTGKAFDDNTVVDDYQLAALYVHSRLFDTGQTRDRAGVERARLPRPGAAAVKRA